MKALDVEINDFAKLRSKPLTNEMGILGINYEQGILWDRAKIKAMETDSPDDYIIIDFTEEEQVIIEEFGRLEIEK